MPPRIALMPWTLSNIQTRNSNKNKHPGIPDKPKPRRKTAEVSAARQQAAEAEKQQEKERTDAAKKLALIEDKLQEEDRRREAERLADTGEPTMSLAIGKARHSVNKNGRTHTKSKSTISRSSDSEHLSDTILSKEKTKKLESNKRLRINSEDEGEYDNDKDGSEDDVDHDASEDDSRKKKRKKAARKDDLDDDIDSDASEDDSCKKKRKKATRKDDLDDDIDSEESEDDSRKKKRKKTTRNDIDKLRKTTAVSGVVNPKQQISDLDETSHRGKNGKKKTGSKDKLSGLLPGWKKEKKRRESSIADEGDESEDNTLAQYGGLVPDNETDEVEARAMKKMTTKKTGDDNMIKIKPNPLAPKKLVEVRQGAKHWSLKHLPNEAQDAWEPEVSTRLRKKGGSSTDPWNFPKMSEIQEIVDEVYGKGKYKVVEDGPFYGLAQGRIQNWRHAFFDAAKKTVASFIDDNAKALETEEDIAGCIASYLSPTTDGQTYTYQWREVDPEADTKKGFLTSALIIKTLGMAHLAKLPEVLCDFTTERPVGAVVLTTQAARVSHALEQWKTGKFVAGIKEFSAENYANKEDFLQVDAHQKRKLKKVITYRTTLFFDAMEEFTPKRWDKIIDGAYEYVPKKTTKKKKRETALPDDVIIIEDESCKRARFVLNDDSEGDAE